MLEETLLQLAECRKPENVQVFRDSFDVQKIHGRLNPNRSRLTPATQKAIEICNNCRIRKACREDAIVNCEQGIRGGTLDDERREIRRERQMARKNLSALRP